MQEPADDGLRSGDAVRRYRAGGRGARRDAGFRRWGGGHQVQCRPAQAEQLVKDLEAAIKELLAIAKQVEPLTEVPPPGKDIYSGMAASKIRKIAGEDPGGYLKANREAREALQATADNVKEALDKYKATEGNVQTSMR